MESRPTPHPFQEMRRLQREMERLFGELTPGWRWPLTGEYPRINLTRTDQNMVLDALCPGVDRAAFEMTVIGDSVTIRGERKPEPNVPDERYHRRERRVGAFARTVQLGERLDSDRTEATYTNGCLHITLARSPETAPKKISIQSQT
jgi:HSP20 family protein